MAGIFKKLVLAGLLALAPQYSHSQEPITILRIEEPVKEAVQGDFITEETPQNSALVQKAFKAVQNAIIPIRHEACFEDILGKSPTNYKGGKGRGVFLSSNNSLFYATCLHNAHISEVDAQKFIRERFEKENVTSIINPSKSLVWLDDILLNSTPKSDDSKDIAVYNVTHLADKLTKKYTPLEILSRNQNIFRLGDKVNWLNYSNTSSPSLEFAKLVNLNISNTNRNFSGGIEADKPITFGYSGQSIFNISKYGEVNIRGIITNMRGEGVKNGNCIFVPISAVQDLIRSFQSRN
jgi:hypothetical protein